MSTASWVAGIPSSWKTVPFGSIFEQRKQRNVNLERDFVLSVIKNRGVIPYTEKGNVGNKVSEDLSKYKLVDPGDFVLNSMNLFMGSVGVSAHRGVTSTAYIVCRPSTSIDAAFFNYVIRCRGFQEYVGFLGKGIMEIREAVRWAALRSVRVPLPPIETQRQIAIFLDRETIRIDELVKKKRAQTARLEEKMSAIISHLITRGLDKAPRLKATGSPYIPEIPSHWSLPRLKQMASVRGGITLGRTLPDGTKTIEVPYLRVANVQAGRLELSEIATIEVTSSELERFRLVSGDVLMNEGGDNDKLGRGAVWKGEIENCIHQNHVFSVRPFSAGVADWISLASNTKYGRDFFFLNSKQSTNLASIAKTKLEQFPVPLPPADEAKAIMKAIVKQSEKALNTIRVISESVARLHERRTALITFSITGQLDAAEAYMKDSLV